MGFEILQYLPQKTHKTPSGWYSFSGPCCVHNGETQDTRGRCGVILDGDDWSVSCFNCGFKARYVVGQPMSRNIENFLRWIGVPILEIQKISLHGLKNKNNILLPRTTKQITEKACFKPVPLPGTARSILSSDTWAVDYLKKKRGLNYRDFPYKITPSERGRNAKRIIIPYYHKNEIVGWVSRYLDDYSPKYVNEHQQDGYLFGLDFQKKEWDFIIVSEGFFDAISIKGVATIHNTISKKQIELLRAQNKEIIIVPDMDKAGMCLLAHGLNAGFSVSTPLWDSTVNDINDAVNKYGKIGTLVSILTNKTDNKIASTVAINKLKRRLKI